MQFMVTLNVTDATVDELVAGIKLALSAIDLPAGGRLLLDEGAITVEPAAASGREEVDGPWPSHPVERVFALNLGKAGWSTYRYHDREVTNAYPHELEMIEQLTGLRCEVIHGPASPDSMVSAEFLHPCVRIGPKLLRGAVEGA